MAKSFNNSSGTAGLNGKPPRLLKIDISVDDYHRLFKNLEFKSTRQSIYFYFDTSLLKFKAELYKRKILLRMRVKETNHLLELKENDELFRNKETRTYLEMQEFEAMLRGSIIPAGDVRQRLKEINLLSPFTQIAVTNTFRSKIEIYGGILTLDETIFTDGRIYYQVEFRSSNTSEEDLQKLLYIIGSAEQINYRTKFEKLWK